VKKTFLYLCHFLWVLFLTLLTQVGGLIWLLILLIQALLPLPLPAFRWWAFPLLYLFCCILVVPPLAQRFGRVPLPVFGEAHLKPHNLLFTAFNRHYVRPDLRAALLNAAEGMQQQYPGAVVRYIDACFPFIDGFPLEPHFSHLDGRKVDLAFFWRHRSDHTFYPGSPSWYGYGICVLPRAGEYDYAADCEGQGYWWISLDRTLAAPYYRAGDFEADEAMSGTLVRLLAESPQIRRMLLQPHLKKRWGLGGFDKIRQQGCKAARHDDHVHVEGF
jgi:hypothetical protein